MNDKDFYMLMALAMGGEENAIEIMEKKGQMEAVNSSRVSKKMFPDKSLWESLGFKFKDIPNDDVLYEAELPEGWKVIPTEHQMWNNIVDKNNMVRATMFYKASFYDRDSHMSLECCYSIFTQYDKDNNEKICFGNVNEVLFCAGQVYKPQNSSPEERRKMHDDRERLSMIAKKFAEENYPDWENPLAYWDSFEKEKAPQK